MCDCFCASTYLLFSLYHIAIGKCKKGIMQAHDPVKRGGGGVIMVCMNKYVNIKPLSLTLLRKYNL